ncbi:MAG TPA: ATP-binding protein, partial [Burkholderiaceae bacterium]|nr:ATP-binding protein [Burkholderiaceae bacterium]
MSAAAPRRARSIRAVLLAGTIATLLAVLGVAAWMSFQGSEEEAQELFDARLATSARVLEAFLARQVEHATVASPIVIQLPGPIEAADHDAPSTAGHYYETKIAFQVWNADRQLLVRSASAPNTPFAPLAAGYSDQPFGKVNWRVFTLASGSLWIQVAERSDIRSELSEKLAYAAAEPLVIGIPLLLVLLGSLIGYGLAPLAKLAQQIETRQADALTPVALPRVPAEIVPVLDALNGLLGRLTSALERERRFTADAAHELRTPLAGLKVHAQNAARASSPAERQASLDRMLVALDRTIHLAEQMLAFNRAAASAPPEHKPVSLRQLATEAIDALHPRIGAHALKFTVLRTPADGKAEVPGDCQKLASLVGNLLDNAVRYAPDGSAIDVVLREEHGTVTLEVSDEGPGIPAELRARVFESYFRMPGSTGAGSGLGLAIVREVARAHGARVEIR